MGQVYYQLSDWRPTSDVETHEAGIRGELSREVTTGLPSSGCVLMISPGRVSGSAFLSGGVLSFSRASVSVQ